MYIYTYQHREGHVISEHVPSILCLTGFLVYLYSVFIYIKCGCNHLKNQKKTLPDIQNTNQETLTKKRKERIKNF